METIRTTIDAARLATIIDLPESFLGQDVEVTIVPKSHQNQDHERQERLEKLCGCLNKYANTELRKLEKTAWAEAAAEKHLKLLEEDDYS